MESAGVKRPRSGGNEETSGGKRCSSLVAHVILIVVGIFTILVESVHGVCIANGGTMSEPKICEDAFHMRASFDQHGVLIKVSKTFFGCVAINNELYRPVEVLIDEFGNVTTTGNVNNPTLSTTDTTLFCLSGGSLYSTYEEELQAPWGYCSCDEWPTQTPTTAVPSSMPSLTPSLAPSIPSSEPTSAPSVILNTLPPKTTPPFTAPSTTPSLLPIPHQQTTTPSVVPTESLAPSQAPTNTPSTAPSTTPSLLPMPHQQTTAPSVVPTESLTPSQAPMSGPTAVPTKYPTKTCTTDGGHKIGRPCVFPFKYKGIDYTECIPFSNSSVAWPYMNENPTLTDTFDKDEAWCAVISDYSNTKKAMRKLWGTCGCWSVEPEETCQVNGEINEEETDVDCGGSKCQPCGYNATCLEHTDCAAGNLCLDDNVCSPVTSVTYHERITLPIELHKTLDSSVLGFLSALVQSRIANSTSDVNAGNPLLSRARVNVDLYVPHVTYPNCTTDGGWAAFQTPCVFPFTYNETIYDQCIDVEQIARPYFGNETHLPPGTPANLYLVHWCPTTFNYDNSDLAVREQWGFCDCKDTWPTRPPTRFPTPTPLGGSLPTWCFELELLWNSTNAVLNHLFLEATLELGAFAVNSNTGRATSPKLLDSSNNGTALDVTIEVEFNNAEKEGLASRTNAIKALLGLVVASFGPYVNNTKEFSIECNPTPTEVPISAPTLRSPTMLTSSEPSTSTVPSHQSFTAIPSLSPSSGHSASPSLSPSVAPSLSPSLAPSLSPTTDTPSNSPSHSPSFAPTTLTPSRAPTSFDERNKLIRSVLQNTNTTGVAFVDHPLCESMVVLLLTKSAASLKDCADDIESCSCLRKMLNASSVFGVICLSRLQTVFTNPSTPNRCGWK